MAHGGDFGADPILRFNGGLFADAEVVKLTPEEISIAGQRQRLGLGQRRAVDLRDPLRADVDPAKRSQIGAHYTAGRTS